LMERQITLRDIVDLREGDVIPVEMPADHVLTANGVPMFHVALGRVRDHLAFQVTRPAVSPTR
jgi:flagellar motor switch protein FliM